MHVRTQPAMVILSLGEIATTFSWLGTPEANEGMDLWRFAKRRRG